MRRDVVPSPLAVGLDGISEIDGLAEGHWDIV